MDDTSFDYETEHVEQASRRFPSHRRGRRPAGRPTDLHYLSSERNSAFGRHAWDEGGHL